MPEMTTLIITRLEEPDAPEGWLVAEGNVPIGLLAAVATVRTPSGAEYRVRDGRLWPGDGPAVAGYDEDPTPRVTDAASGVAWELKPDWRARALRPGPDGSHTLNIPAAMARDYTLEDAQGTVPARVKLLLAHLALAGSQTMDTRG
jgi:hypothetical protein